MGIDSARRPASAVLDYLFAGDHPVLVQLRVQPAGASVLSREYSGVGFFTHFAVADDAAALPVRQLRFGDVEATIAGLEHGAGFVLFADDGRVSMLEGYS